MATHLESPVTVSRTRKNPPPTPKAKGKFMWTEPQRKIVVSWMKNNSKFYNDKNNTRNVRYNAILASLKDKDFPNKDIMNIDTIDSCIRYLHKGYIDGKARLMKTGQGLTAEESDQGYKNLYGMFFIILKTERRFGLQTIYLFQGHGDYPW